MMKFKDITEKHKNGTYVSAQVSKESQDQIEQWVKNVLGLKSYIDPSEYHITLCYSNKPVYSAELLDRDITMAATPIGLTVFETKIMAEKYCLVLKIKSDEATKIHNTLKDMGATFDYPEYTPHITLLYSHDPIEFDEKAVPDFDVTLDLINVEGLSETITIKTKE